MNEIQKMVSDWAMDRLYERAQHYAEHSISENTKTAYERDWTHFAKWCIDHECDSLPATPETVSLYLTDLADSDISVATISRRMTSISVIHNACRNPNPCKSAEVGRVIGGIRRENGKPQNKARPISWSELKHMVTHCDSSIMGRRDAALLLLGWTSAARRSELVSLDVDDVAFVDEGILLTIRRSKTDQTGTGQTVAIPYGIPPYCPVMAVRDWIDRSHPESLGTDAEDKSLFIKLGIAQRKNWWAQRGQRMNDRMVSIIVKRYAAFAGLPTAKISAHSLRRGFATECGSHAIPERLIARHTRHQSMEVLRGYIADGAIWRENPLPFIYSNSSSSADIQAPHDL